MSGRLEGLVALVTGGARGMGGATAALFVREGARVVIADVLESEGSALAAELGDAATFVRLDVVDEASWDAAVRHAVDWAGRLDVLVNNAGIGIVRPLPRLRVGDYERVVAVNQRGVFLGMRAVVPPMVEQRSGSIVNISSFYGLFGGAGAVAYAASKFAVTGMTKVAALELAAYGVRVNSVHPGVIETPMSAGADLSSGASAIFEIPLGRFGRPEDVASLSLFLASPESSYCTGAEFVVDGGLSAGRINDTERAFVTREVERRLHEGV